MIRASVAALAALSLFEVCPRNTYPPGAERSSDPARDCFARVARELSSDDMEGRGVGSGGLRRSGKYLEKLLTTAGLEGPVDGGVFQSFDVHVGVQPVPGGPPSGGGGPVALEPKLVRVRNVLALLPGRGALADETVVVGAHYDHLGEGGAGSTSPDEPVIYNGADDNASGTAAMVCAAYELIARGGRGAMAGGKKTEPEPDRRAVLFAAFTAHEIGLAGASYYVDHPVRPLESTVAMVNLDAVGRVRDGRLSVLGADSAAAWGERLPRLGSRYGLTLDLVGDGDGPSDHAPFVQREVPVAHLSSGAHAQVGTPDDDFDTLNLDGGAAVTMLLADLIDDLRTTPEAPKAAPRAATE